MKKKFKILDLFSGAGGFSKGLDMVKGFETVVAVDFDKSAIETFKHNFPSATCIKGDIRKKEIKDKIIEISNDKNVNMIVGDPPCQGFSLKGKNKGLEDPRNFLFLEYFDTVKKIRPEIFIIENVKNMVSASKGYFLKEVYCKFEHIGYKVNHGILNALDFGVPQNRQRTIIIGTLLDNKISIPKSKDIKDVTVRDAISDLSYLEFGEGTDIQEYKMEPKTEYQKELRKNSKKLYHHKATNHSDVAIKKLQLIPPEGDKRSMPKELVGNQLFSTTWSRLVWNKPSPNIDTRFDTPSNGRNSHPYLNRAITPREAARLQSFPDTFIFKGTKTSICRQIGNAVPPLLAKGIANHIKGEIEKYEKYQLI